MGLYTKRSTDEKEEEKDPVVTQHLKQRIVLGNIESHKQVRRNKNFSKQTDSIKLLVQTFKKGNSSISQPRFH